MPRPTPEEEVEMMTSPGRWPCWPVLPMVGPNGKVGLMVEADSNVEPIVYLRNLFDRSPLDENKAEVFTDFYAVVDAGWRID